MGILRTILALAVVVYHSFKIFGLHLCGGQVAVESFYMISGFYMALILNEKYIGPGYYKTFILSRFYRIFPVYWIVLVSALLLSLIGYAAFNNPYYLARYISNYQCLSGTTIAYLVLENVVVFGQDLLYFLRIDEHCRPEFVYNVLSYKHAGFQYLLVPQAWSISIECLFYIIAPFLVTKKISWQLALVLTGLGCKAFFDHYYYLCFDPWTYRFFPFELAFFLAGSLAYRYYKYIQHKTVSPWLGYTLLTLCIGGVCLIDEIQMEENWRNSLFYIVVLCSLPYLFHAFKNNSTDRYIGELSFSVYISHHLVVSVLRPYYFGSPQYMEFYGYTAILCSLILAFILQNTAVKAIERYRAKRFS
ncbi:MAG: acyltransferase [Bacteroidetes bacterium]|nr:acyltransferase [Bacteroidota bacterium]